ncbi:MAG: pantetheine-phosphate adenylyltransferase [Saccharofermentanales bacterium]|nr:pantetheine-phosphate adenylyltransferase [Bacillota bacterium]NLB08916.1 pantetheine-phosphate adenylyltransferase [Clostridiales bacterium]
MNKLIYSGTFDPFTNGHLDIATRASKLCTELIILVLSNQEKTALFTYGERLDLIRRSITELKNVRVDLWDGLLVDYCRKNGVTTIIRGLRSETDYNYEKKMALNNRILLPDCETLFITATPEYSCISSSMVKIIANYGGDIEQMVPAYIAAAIKAKLTEN